MRQQFPIACSELVKLNSNVIVLLGDIGHFSFRHFQNEHPDNFYNLGIAEQALIGVASGLASLGMIPIVHSIAPFITERCYEQIKIDIGYQNPKMKKIAYHLLIFFLIKFYIVLNKHVLYLK